MGWLQRLGNSMFPGAEPNNQEYPRPIRSQDGGVLISTMEELEALIRAGGMGGSYLSKSGQAVTSETALRLSAVYACIRIISGGVANMPLHVMRKLPNGSREKADDTRLARILRRKPCKFMRAKQFRRMATAHVLLKGNFFALKVRGPTTGHLLELIPMNPDRITVEMKANMDVVYKYTRPTDGKIIEYTQAEIFHLYSITLNGFSGVSPITYARETIGAALSMEDHSATIYKNGARVSGVFSTDKRLGEEGRETIKAGLDEYRQSGQKEGQDLVLEDGLTYERMSLTPQDMQYIEAKKMTATDIFMLFGIPPHMASVVEKQTSYGSGVEEQNKGFVTWTLEDYLTMWEEAIDVDLIPDESDLYALHERKSLLRGTAKDRGEFYTVMLQNRVMNPNEVREEEDMNPYDGGNEFLPTPTMSSEDPANRKDGQNEPDSEPNP